MSKKQKNYKVEFALSFTDAVSRMAHLSGLVTVHDADRSRILLPRAKFGTSTIKD